MSKLSKVVRPYFHITKTKKDYAPETYTKAGGVYDEHYHPEQLVSLARQGLLLDEICAGWNISRDTFDRWFQKCDKFKHAVELAKVHLSAYYLRNVRLAAFKEKKLDFLFMKPLITKATGYREDKSDADFANYVPADKFEFGFTEGEAELEYTKPENNIDDKMKE